VATSLAMWLSVIDRIAADLPYSGPSRGQALTTGPLLAALDPSQIR